MMKMRLANLVAVPDENTAGNIFMPNWRNWIDAFVDEESGWQSHYSRCHAGSNPALGTIL